MAELELIKKPGAAVAIDASLTVLLMATKDDHPGLKNAVESLAKHGYRHRVLGLGEPWGGWPHRMRSYRDACLQIAKDQGREAVVVCMDAYDALCVRKFDPNFLTMFQKVGRPVVMSLERACGGNCLSIRDWWRNEGKKYYVTKPPRDRYVNGGLLMGYAGALAEVYGWMLEQGAKDDQVGLAKWALDHRDRWAPDVEGFFMKNKIYGDKLTEQDLTGEGCYFAHFPGMRDWDGSSYDETVLRVLKRKSGVKSKNLGSPLLLSAYIIATVLVVVAFVLTLWVLAPSHWKQTAIRTLLSPFTKSN